MDERLRHHGSPAIDMTTIGPFTVVEEPGQLDRRLGLRHLLVYGMLAIVPIAPMAVYGFVARQSFGMVPLVYAIGIVAMLFTALSYRQMSRVFPFAGSVYSYVQRGLHPYAGFLAGWMILADYLLTPALIYAFSASWLHGLMPTLPSWIWVVGFVAINTSINILGIRLQARMHFSLLIVELVALAIFVTLAIHYVFIAHQGAGGWSATPVWQPQHMNGGFLATATSIAVLSFLGFDSISTLAEEAREPRRTVGNATVLTLLILGVIFIAETYLAALAHPDYRSLDAELGFFQIARQIGGQWLYLALILINVAAAGIANALTAQAAISRILFSMGRDRVLPGGGFLSYVNPRFRTPMNATLLVAAISLLLALLVPGVVLLKLVNFGALTAFMLLNLTVFVYFFLKKKQRRAILGYAVFPMTGLAIVAFVWCGFDRVTFLFGGAWLLFGLVLSAVKYRHISSIVPAS